MGPIRIAKTLSATLAFSASFLLLPSATAQMSARTLTGTVTEQGHEPLRGAVVQVEDDATHAIATFLTDRNGHYHFQRINSGDDYRLWATYRGHRSHTKTISKFNSNLQPNITLVIKLD